MLLQPQEILTDQEFQAISDLVYRHCGINLHEGKKELVQARIAKKLRQTGLRSGSEYLQRVLSDASGEEFAELVDALSTNLTSFFREEAHFQFLREHFLPAALETKAASRQRRIRAWSAGCSSGEEPYSLAITLLEAVKDPQVWDVKILATDISRRVLRVASNGVYDCSRLACVNPALRSRYFVETGQRGKLRVAESLRRCVRFNYLNLQDPWPFRGPFDLIFCRNVMIYFDKPTQERLISRFFSVLGSGGLLFTGHSESLTGVKHGFRYVRPTIYAKP